VGQVGWPVELAARPGGETMTQTNGEWLSERVFFAIVVILVVAGFFVVMASVR
jgi:hypothetical protein